MASEQEWADAFNAAENSFGLTTSSSVTLSISGANAQAVMGNYAGHYVFVDEANQFQAAPVERTPTAHIAGWEGAGPQSADAAEPATDLIGEMIADLLQMKQAVKGTEVAGAITALHGQRRADGRPVTFIPEID